MQLVSLPAEEAAVRRFVTALWLPYRRELAATGLGPALATDVDVVETEVTYRLEQLETDGHRTWVSVGGLPAETPSAQVDLSNGDGTLAGFLSARPGEAPPVFDSPNHVVIADVYVPEPQRGSGLADEMLDRARDHAREIGADALALDVDDENERALAFYENHGFETQRRRMTRPVDRS